ncbi:unnamed protein product [Toxocara canis]|nr:unnamed protein product [Toxocara canis]
MRFAPVEGKKSDTERRTQRAPHSMSIMWMCNPSTSVALGVIDESAADLRGGSAANPNSSALTALSKRHTVDFVCCSVTLQKRNLPNNTQRCERHTATSRLTLSASEPFCNAARSSTARPLCRSEYVTVDVTVCRKGSTRTVRWAAKQSWSTTLSARAPLPHRKRVFLQRLELCPDLALDSNVHLEYKRLKTKKIVEYRMPLLWKVN